MIKYSGYPVIYTEFGFEVAMGSAYTNMLNALLSCGFEYVRPLSMSGMSHGTMLQTKRTPQGLQAKLSMYRSDTGVLWFYWHSMDESVSTIWGHYLYPRAGSLIRFIGNPYQFFTFKYNNLLETGNVMIGGVPWIPSFQAPLRVVNATPSSPIVVTTDDPHYYSGELIVIEGAIGLQGLNGTHQAVAVDEYHLRLENSQGIGAYVPNSGVLAGHDRLARCVWSQSSGYANGWLYHDPANCLRYHLDSAPFGWVSLGMAYANNSSIMNQYTWCIPDDYGHSNKPAASRVFKFVPYGIRWFDQSYVAYEPMLMMGEVSEDNDNRIVGQLWDSICMNLNFGQMDITTAYDNEAWHIYTSVLGMGGGSWSPGGVLCLKISNNNLIPT
jgi:hypothetical protein